jgi:hypothetical protein
MHGLAGEMFCACYKPRGLPRSSPGSGHCLPWPDQHPPSTCSPPRSPPLTGRTAEKSPQTRTKRLTGPSACRPGEAGQVKIVRESLGHLTNVHGIGSENSIEHTDRKVTIVDDRRPGACPSDNQI